MARSEVKPFGNNVPSELRSQFGDWLRNCRRTQPRKRSPVQPGISLPVPELPRRASRCDYSSRNAAIGSVLVARRAGIQQAIPPATVTSTAAIPAEAI